VRRVRALVTGGRGFVGTWLRAHLEACGDEVVVADHDTDVRDPEAVAEALGRARPDAVYHLAARSHVGRSWSDPIDTFVVNALGTLHVLEAARRLEPMPTVLVPSSADAYGAVDPSELPLHEDAPLKPVSPYAVSKVAAEQLALQAHRGFGVPVVVARAFNHVGPGQDSSFVVPALASRIRAAVACGEASIRVGDLGARRDLTDVRDVVRAYRLLVERGERGGVYNVCTGVGVSVHEIAERLMRLAGARLELVVDPELVRPVEVPALVGDPSKLKAATGWQPRYSLDETLADVLTSVETDQAAARASPAPSAS
jgi:GDP-4-dehydro-6-deoxy-D-mannose reductase